MFYMFTGYMLHVLQVTCSNTQVTCFACSNTRFTWAYVTFLSHWFLISLALGKLRLNINFMCFVRDCFYRILLLTMFPLLSAKTSNKRSHSDNNQHLPFRGGCRTFFFVFLIGIHSMQGWTATMRYGVTWKEAQKRLQDTENLFRKNLQLKDVY